MIQVDLSQLNGWVEAIEAAPQRLEHEMIVTTGVALHEGIGYAQEFAPRDEGTLASSIRIMEAPSASGGSFSGAYGSDLEYAHMREEGGTIYPRNGQFLVFEVGGQLVFARKVEQEGSHYMKDSADQMQSRVGAIYQLGVDRALEGI